MTQPWFDREVVARGGRWLGSAVHIVQNGDRAVNHSDGHAEQAPVPPPGGLSRHRGGQTAFSLSPACAGTFYYEIY